MHIITLKDKEHFEYLMFVFHKHVSSGISPEELSIASQVWNQLRGVQELDPAALEQGEDKEVIRVQGPVSIEHKGDLSLPVG